MENKEYLTQESTTKKLLFNKFQIIGFLLYFAILLTERILALIFSVNINNEYSLTSGSFIAISTYSVTALSVVVGVILFIKPIIKMLNSLFSKQEFDFNLNIKQIMIASMALLYSGMMHTGFTIVGLQFVAYGFLLLSVLFRTLENPNKTSISSLIYISIFSMAIPVVYSTSLQVPLSILFYTSEFLAVFTLIPVLGVLFYSHYKNFKTNTSIIFPLLMSVLVGLVVGLKWIDEINYFVLVAAILTLISYIPFKLLSK